MGGPNARAAIKPVRISISATGLPVGAVRCWAVAAKIEPRLPTPVTLLAPLPLFERSPSPSLRDREDDRLCQRGVGAHQGGEEAFVGGAEVGEGDFGRRPVRK